VQPTEEQQAIIDFVAAGKGSLIVEALAGSGKTWTIRQSLPTCPQRSILICAFNKRIADEISSTLPKMPKTHAVHVKTFHALGLRTIKVHFPHLEVSAAATEDLINTIAGKSADFRAKRAAVKILRYVKEAFVWSDFDHVAAYALGVNEDFFNKMNERSREYAVRIAADAYERGKDLGKRDLIDFCDMVWAPVVLDLAPPSRYQILFIDELQDISRPQFAMVRQLMLPTSRFVGVGDQRQQVYDFRGSLGEEAWSEAEHAFKIVDILRLTQTFRCSAAVVKEAQRLVPRLRALPDAPPGSATSMTLADLPVRIGQGHSDEVHSYVLSRTNAALLDCALFLWSRGTKFVLNNGKAMLAPLFELLDHVLDLRSKDAFIKSIKTWYDAEFAKAEKAGALAYADHLTELVEMLHAASKYAVPTQLRQLLVEILVDNKSGVLLSTVHKVKGLEADRVYLLKQTFGMHRGDPIERTVSPAELNLEYVAITRAREHIIWVDIRERESNPAERTDEELAEMSVEDLEQLMLDYERAALMEPTEDAMQATMEQARRIELLLGAR
jgi:DNA helicase-2/ATP-dependent DNA helicase PcrA